MESRNDALTMDKTRRRQLARGDAHRKFYLNLHSKDVALIRGAEMGLQAGTNEMRRWSQIELDNETSRVARANSSTSAEENWRLPSHVQPLRREPSREWPELFFPLPLLHLF